MNTVAWIKEVALHGCINADVQFEINTFCTDRCPLFNICMNRLSDNTGSRRAANIWIKEQEHTAIEWVKEVAKSGCSVADRKFNVKTECNECTLETNCGRGTEAESAKMWLKEHSKEVEDQEVTNKSTIEQQMIEFGLDMIRMKRKPTGEIYWLVQGDNFPSHFIGNSIKEAIDNFRTEIKKGETK